MKKYRKKIIAVVCTQAEIESVTFKVTWPWRTRSPVKVTTLAYIPLTFLSLKNLETKKIIAVACIQAEIESVTFKVTWLWRTRSRVKVTTFAYILLTFLRWITLETKKNWMFQRVYLSNYYSISLFSEFKKIMTSFKVTAWRQLSDNAKKYNAVFKLCHSSRNTWNFAWISLFVIKLSMIIYLWGL